MRLAAAAALLLLAVAPPLPAAAPPPLRRMVVCDDVMEPATLDPHRQFSEKNHTLVQQIHEGLVRFDEKGRVVAALAESWERVDPRRYRFRLRRGVTFHNGEPFDAESVRFSIERYLDPATGFPAAGYLSTIERAEIVDPLTVDIVTRGPDGLLLNRLAGFVLIVPPRYAAEKGAAALHERPIGTGPFEFVAWERGREVRLRANRDYWRKGFPKLDELRFRFVPADRQMGALVSGEIDLLTEMHGTQTTEAIGSGLIEVLKRPSFYTVAGSFNISRKPLDDARVRRALNLAVNRQELIRYDLLGNGRPIATVTMPGEEGHNALLEPYSFRPKEAARLLREAGYPDGIRLKAAAKVQGERAAKIIAKQLEKIGVSLELWLFTDAELIPALAAEPWDMFLAGCPDPMAHSFFIQSIFLSGVSPYRVAVNERYDAMVAEMASTLDAGARRALAEKIDATLHDEALMLFLYQRIKTYGARKGVRFTPSVTGMPYFVDAENDETKP